MFFHVRSFSFIFVHCRSFSIIFSHFLSFSFIFFVFVGSQNLIFLGLNFVSISLDSSYVKNQFLGPSRVVVPLWTLSFFPTFFSSRFFCLFPCFLFFIFSHFWFISSFFDFLMFFIFSFFPKKKFLLFFFLVFLSNICFCLRWYQSSIGAPWRCGCPDDMGRDSWDWVGLPTWERA